jgi:hypothetical protein
VSHLFAADAPDLAGGRYAAPAWLILAVAAVVAVFAAVYLTLRFRRSERDKSR